MAKVPATIIHHLHAQAQDEAAAVLLPDERATAAEGGRSGESPLTTDLSNPALYFNRELSWLDFNWRVVNEALDPSVPLLERVKFLAIAASNLDEFFMIRVAGLRQQRELGVPDVPMDGMTPDETLDRIAESVERMTEAMTNCFTGDIAPRLDAEGIRLHSYADLDVRANAWCETFFYKDVFPVLTPLAIDPGHPFPHLLNRSLNLLIQIYDSVTEEERVAVVQVPPVVRRLVEIPTYRRGTHYVLLDEVIARHADALFPGLQVRNWYPFRVTRDADLEIADDEASDLLKTIEEQVRRRRWGAVVRSEIDTRMPKKMRKELMKSMRLTARDLYQVNGPINLADFMELTRIDAKHLKDRPFAPRIAGPLRGDDSIFDVVKRQDVLLHHPYESFSPVVEFIEAAADDPKAIAIKMTLYRTGGESSIIRALTRAAENGKQVTAFVELKARFDEENNIIWARALEKAGVHVVYGIIGLKTHCKLALVVRREKKVLRTYVHMGTGNYNEITARVYTDFGLLTARENIAYEATALFNYLTGYSHKSDWEKITIAPISMRQKLLALIQREAALHSERTPGRIIAKMNALVDPQIIRALYRAAQAGVAIDLLVRGICCLRPGIPGLSETIRVRSVVGRFLEHSRAFVFGNGGSTEVYIGSADWMPRNLNRRVEMMVEVEDDAIKTKFLAGILPVCLADNVKAYELSADGTYTRLTTDAITHPVNSQEEFLRLAEIASREPQEEDEEEGD